MKKFFITLLALLLVGTVGVFLWGKRFLDTPASLDKEEVIFEVEPGQSFKAVAERLRHAGLITDEKKFYVLGRLTKAQSKIRIGEYALRHDMKPMEILQIITSGKSVERPVTIQEGLNIFEIGELLERHGLTKRDEFLSLVRDRALIRELLGETLPSLEGYLFPDTYRVTKYSGAKGLVRMMVQRFLANYNEISGHEMSRHQLVTLASIIEKETGAPEERPMISSVFHNRLRKGMRLQTDPTIIYGLFQSTGRWNRNISKADLLRDHPYNSYTRSGLPPGPISNPGRLALQAAARPARTEYLFFVSKNDGTHVFSADYKAHERAVKQFQVNKKAREGKSWRDLHKRAEPAKRQ